MPYEFLLLLIIIIISNKHMNKCAMNPEISNRPILKFFLI